MLRPALLLALLSLPAFAAPPALETSARFAYMEDFETGRVLYAKAPDERMPTSSMSKMMTLYVVFEALKSGHASLDDKLTVSKKAWATQGSKMFIDLDDQIRIEDLIRGVAIASGNDAAVCLAEGLGGSESGFAETMNETAKKLGMANSHFTNASGLPEPEHYSTAHDLAILGRHLIEDFPEYYKYFSEIEYSWRNKKGVIKQGNRNPLLYKKVGADGIKTGHAEDVGFGLTGSAVQNGRRVILVVNGIDPKASSNFHGMQDRADEAERLIEYAYREFSRYTVKAGTPMDDAPVWLGEAPTVPLVLAKDVGIVLTREERKALKATVKYQGPIAAPIAKGQQVGTLVLAVPNGPTVEAPIETAGAVERLGLPARMMAAAKHLVGGKSG